jgi:hypothetical protein
VNLSYLDLEIMRRGRVIVKVSFVNVMAPSGHSTTSRRPVWISLGALVGVEELRRVDGAPVVPLAFLTIHAH